MKTNKLWGYIIAVVAFFAIVAYGVFNSVTAQSTPKELKDVVTSFTIRNSDNRIKQPPYTFIQGADYTFQFDFDLHEYDHDLNDGDYFTVEIGAPLNFQNTSFNIYSTNTDVAVGEATVVSKGENLGATITVKLTNIAAYKEQRSADSVKNVKGTFYAAFDSTIQDVNTSYETPISGVLGISTLNLTILPRENNKIGTTDEVLWKGGGVIKGLDTPIVSNVLNNSFSVVHPWNVAINRSKTELKDYVLVDEISKNGSPMQFIPETFELREVEFADGTRTAMKIINRLSYADLVAQNMIVFENSYTKFTLSIPTIGAKSYQLTYSTSAPNDGTNVSNSVTAYSEGQILQPWDAARNTTIASSAVSHLAVGGTIYIDVAYSIVLYKVDNADVSKRLAGAVFAIEGPNGYYKEFTTGADGMIYVPALDSGTYRVTEIKAPDGYVLPENPSMEVVVDNKGAVKTITNDKFQEAIAQLIAVKILHNRTLVANEFEFELLSAADNSVLDTKMNDENGNVVFDQIKYDKPGVHKYIIREKSGKLPDVTYDTEDVLVTVEVFQTANGGMLIPKVDYSRLPVFVNWYKGIEPNVDPDPTDPTKPVDPKPNIDPDPNTPSVPMDPKPNQPTTPNTVGKIDPNVVNIVKQEQPKATANNQLPNTGTENLTILTLASVVLIIAGGAILVVGNLKKEQ